MPQDHKANGAWHLYVAMSYPTPVRPEICTELYIERCVCVNMHSEDAVSANGGLSTTQTSTLLAKCRRWIRSYQLFLLIFNLFCVNATFSSQNIRFTPLSGYEIGSKHPPIDSAPLIWSEDVLWCTYFQVVSSGFAIKMCLLHVSIKKPQQFIDSWSRFINLRASATFRGSYAWFSSEQALLISVHWWVFAICTLENEWKDKIIIMSFMSKVLMKKFPMNIELIRLFKKPRLRKSWSQMYVQSIAHYIYNTNSQFVMYWQMILSVSQDCISRFLVWMHC